MKVAETSRPDTPARKPWSRRRRDLGEHVARTVSGLQVRLLRDPPQPEAVSALARLRRGIGRTPGFDYTLERYLQVPDELLGYRPPDDAEATDAEHAMHDAVTLYALHQQSRRERMHVDGRGLGQALAELVRASGGPDGVRRRFAALGTASTYHEGIYHLRSLITMLREQQIPLDYGLLADDLQTLRLPARRPQVQAIWGREFFRSRPSTDVETPATDAHEKDPS
ncbi:type I-E CRISPR-associated protein Cse2/CasB [Micromonospora peucetia]|uniref:type I-E CRISPR-associated protein Cse2/CasB n=1 Tax=Micromonospora peucetia TaxID=47871 RepID=UPI003316A1F1